MTSKTNMRNVKCAQKQSKVHRNTYVVYKVIRRAKRKMNQGAGVYS